MLLQTSNYFINSVVRLYSRDYNSFSMNNHKYLQSNFMKNLNQMMQCAIVFDSSFFLKNTRLTRTQTCMWDIALQGQCMKKFTRKNENTRVRLLELAKTELEASVITTWYRNLLSWVTKRIWQLNWRLSWHKLL